MYIINVIKYNIYINILKYHEKLLKNKIKICFINKIQINILSIFHIKINNFLVFKS